MNEDNWPLILYASSRCWLTNVLLLQTGKSEIKIGHIMDVLYSKNSPFQTSRLGYAVGSGSDSILVVFNRSRLLDRTHEKA